VSGSTFDILGVVYESGGLKTSLVRDPDGQLCLLHEVQEELSGDLPSVFKAATKRAIASNHQGFERVLAVAKGGYYAAFKPGERLKQLHTSAVYSGDGSLPKTLVWQIIIDIVTALDTLHQTGQTNGPFNIEDVVIGVDGHTQLVGQPLSAVAAHRASKLSTTASDLRCLSSLATELLPAEQDESWSELATLIDELKDGRFPDAEDCLEHVRETGAYAEGHGEISAWLKAHYSARLDRWDDVSSSDEPVSILSALYNGVPVREQAKAAPVLTPVSAEPAVRGGTRSVEPGPRGPLSLDDMLGSLSDTNATGDPESAPVLEVVEVAFGVVRSVTVLYPGDSYSQGGRTIAKLAYEGATITLPDGVTADHFRLGQSEPASGQFALDVGDRAEFTFQNSSYRIRVDRAARTSGRSIGKRLPWKLWAACIMISLGSHFGFGIAASMFITANVELPTKIDEKELFAREINLDELKEKKKPKPKKKKKLKPKIKPKKKKKKPKKTVVKKVKTTEPKPVISNNLRSKLNKRIKRARAKGASTAQSLLKQVMKANDTSAPSLSQIRSNLDAVANAKGKSGTSIMGSLTRGGPGGRIVARGSGGGVVGTKGGVAGGTGRLAGRARTGKIRGKVRSVRALARVRGSLSKAEVFRVISRATGRIQRCYEKELMRSKKKLNGKVTAQWTIKLNGRVSGTRVKLNTLGNAKIASCVLRVIRGLRFPKPKGGSVQIVYPFIFSAR